MARNSRGKPRGRKRKQSLSLAGLKVCLAGSLRADDVDLDTFESLISFEEGELVSDVDAETDLLVVLSKRGSASLARKAQALVKQGQPIQQMTLEEFRDALRPSAEEAAQMLKFDPDGMERLNLRASIAPGVMNAVTKIDLSGINLKGADLTSADLMWASLDNSNLTEAELTQAYFDGLHNVRLNKASGDSFYPGSLSHCRCRGVEFTGLSCQTIESCDFSSANLDGCYLAWGSVESTSFSRAWMTNADLQSGTFQDVKFTGTDFSDTNLSSTAFSSSELRRAVLHRALLIDASFEDCDLTGADFSDSLLVGTRFIGCAIDRARFDNAVILGVVFENTETGKARNLPFEPSITPQAGSACAQLKNIGGVNVTLGACISLPEGEVTIYIECGPASSLTVELTLNETKCGYDFISHREFHDESDAMVRAAVVCGHGEFAPESVFVNSSRSKIKGPALKKLAQEAFCEVFGS